MGFFHTVLYTPIYNLLVLLIDVVPGGDLGIAVILATLIVRFVLWPLSMSAARTQKAMKAMDPELKEVRKKFKNDQERQMKEMMALYKKYGVHPFASLLPLLIQIPVIIGLYWVFSSKSLPGIDPSILYPFVTVPDAVSVAFLGLASITGHSIVLAIIAAFAQLAHSWYAIPVPPPSAEVEGPGADIARAMALQMRYILPLIVGVAAYTSGAIALYFITGSLVSIFQEFIVRRTNTPTPATV